MIAAEHALSELLAAEETLCGMDTFTDEDRCQVHIAVLALHSVEAACRERMNNEGIYNTWMSESDAREAALSPGMN
jgi:hypothetical protein